MAGSYSKINYRLRPAKAIERKIIGNFLRCLTPFGEVRNYRYIGFGSTYFSDFILFHKLLHMEEMISIEKDRHAKERFEYNKPFQCIQMEYGTSNEVLPRLKWNNPNWNKKSIVWLDYDNPLEDVVLDDVNLLVSKLVSGSVLIVTVSAEPDKKEGLSKDELDKYREKILRERISSNKIPYKEIKPVDLTGKNLVNLYKRIIVNQFKQSFRNVNAARSEEEKKRCKQIFDFRYSDGARMLTLGWLIYDQNDYEKVERCMFDQCFSVIEDESIAIVDESTVAANEIAAAANEIIATANEIITVADESLVAADEIKVAANEIITAANEIVTATDKCVVVMNEAIALTDDNFAAPSDGANEVDESAAITDDNFAAPPDEVDEVDESVLVEDVFYEINVPNLTLREIQYLDSKMPTANYKEIERLCIPLKDIRYYAELYKYFPSFVEMTM